jgi:hypothetical protein
MKKLLAALTLLTGMTSAFAAGPLDGIYSCSVNVLGSFSQSYVTINGHPDGTSIFAVAAVSPSQAFYGYGIGTATSTSFTGSTMFGQPFNLAVDGSGNISGTIRILINGVFANGTVGCFHIF